MTENCPHAIFFPRSACMELSLVGPSVLTGVDLSDLIKFSVSSFGAYPRFYSPIHLDLDLEYLDEHLAPGGQSILFIYLASAGARTKRNQKSEVRNQD